MVRWGMKVEGKLTELPSFPKAGKYFTNMICSEFLSNYSMFITVTTAIQWRGVCFLVWNCHDEQLCMVQLMNCLISRHRADSADDWVSLLWVAKKEMLGWSKVHAAAIVALSSFPSPCLRSVNVSCSSWTEAGMSYDDGLRLVISASSRCALFNTALRKPWDIRHIKSLSVDSITTPVSCPRKVRLQNHLSGRRQSLLVQSTGKVLW